VVQPLTAQRGSRGRGLGTTVPPSCHVQADGLISKDNVGDFTFANAVRLWGTQNPRFFEGTVVAKEAAAVLAQPALRAAAE
jgi:hypothetical protein